MLQVSNEARATIKDSLDDSGQAGHVFRIAQTGEELAMSLGTPEEDDEVYEHDGQPILAVPSELAQALDATLDVERTNEGARLVLI